MKCVRLAAIAMIAVAVGAAMVWAAEDKPLKQVFEELLPGMGADQGYEGPQQQWQEVCFRLGAPGNEAQRTEACTLMAEKLSAETPARARIWLLKQIERIGHEECVEAVAKMLDDQDPLVRDAAVRALANNPSKQVRDALSAKLISTEDSSLKIALLNALGFYVGQAPCQRTVAELTNPDPAVAAAAASFFGTRTSKREMNTPDPMVGILATVRAKAQGEVRFRLGDALLQCADQMLKEGKATEAAAIYKELNTPEEPRPIRMAALQGTLNAAGDQAGAVILEVLAGDDPDARAVAIGHIENLSGQAVQSLGEGLSKLPPAGQIGLMGALASRRVTAAMPAVLAAIKSEDEDVKLAALRALGAVGDASVVPLLVETMVSGGPAGNAAREALESTFADGVDPKLIEAMKGANDLGQRATLIEVLDRRRAEAAVPAVLEEASHENGDIRRRAMAALGRLAGPDDVAGMIRAVLKIQDRGQREEAERAITEVCSRAADESKQAEPVLAVFNSAGDAEQGALLPVLGRIGGADALAVMRAALGSSDAQRYDNAVRGICNWPDAGVADDLLGLSQNARQPEQRIRALRAFIRVIALPGERPSEQKLAMLQKAMESASRDEERNLILDRAAAVRTIETLRFVAPCLDKPELAQQACRTAVELAHHRDLREPNQAEFDEALDKVIAVCKDNGLVDRAKGYRSAP